MTLLEVRRTHFMMRSSENDGYCITLCFIQLLRAQLRAYSIVTHSHMLSIEHIRVINNAVGAHTFIELPTVRFGLLAMVEYIPAVLYCEAADTECGSNLYMAHVLCDVTLFQYTRIMLYGLFDGQTMYPRTVTSFLGLLPFGCSLSIRFSFFSNIFFACLQRKGNAQRHIVTTFMSS